MYAISYDSIEATANTKKTIPFLRNADERIGAMPEISRKG